MATLSTAAGLARRFADALSDDRTWIVGDHVARLGGYGGVFAGLADRAPGRVLDLPVADRGTLGLATGLALAGHRVVAELAAAGRLWASLEVLAEAAEIAAFGDFPLRLSIRVPCGGEAGPIVDRPAAQALAAIEGLQVLSPSTAGLAFGCWEAALAARTPTVVLEPRTLINRRAEGTTPVKPGVAREIRPGGDVLLVSWGGGVSKAVQVADDLLDDGIQAGLLDLVSLSPLDTSTLGRVVASAGRVVVVDAPEGGVATEVIRAAIDEAFLRLEAPLLVVPPVAERIRSAATETALY